MRWLIVVAFVAGGLSGYLVSRALSSDLEAPRDDSEVRPLYGRGAETPKQGTAPSLPPLESGIPKTAATEAAPIEPRPREEPRDLNESISIEPRFQASRGDGVIRGTVLTGVGKPVPGILVEALPEDEPPFGRFPSVWEADRDSYLRFAAQHYGWMRAMGGSTTTGRDGTFEIGGLQRVAYHIRAKADGWEIEPPRWIWNRDLIPDAEISLLANAQVQVSAKVVQADGSPPAKARLNFEQGSGSTSTSWSPGDPQVEIEPGSYQAWAETDDERSETQRVELALGENPDLHFELAPRTGIRGRIVSEAPLPVREYLAVSWTRVRPGSEIDPSRFRRMNDSEWVDPQDLRFELLDLDPGEYHVGTGRSGIDAETIQVVQVVAGQIVDVELRISAPEADQALHVRVIDEEGEVLKDASFSVSYETDGGGDSDHLSTTSTPEGVYLLDLSETVWGIASGKISGTARLHIQVEDFGSRSTVIQGAPGSEITVRFEPPARLQLTVSGYEGSGYEDSLSAHLVPASDDDPGGGSFGGFGGFRGMGDGRLDFEGQVELGPVTPGEHRVLVSQNSSQLAVLDAPVTLTSGDNELTLPLPPLYDVTFVFPDGMVPDLMLNRPGQRSISSSAWLSSEEAEDGKLTARGLPAGEYQVQSMGMNGGFMRFQVPAAGEVVYEPQEIDSIEVEITDPGCYAAQLGLRDGDLIVGIDDVELESYQQIALLFSGFIGRDSGKLQVLRGSQKLTIECDPSKLFEEESKGYSFEPSSRR